MAKSKKGKVDSALTEVEALRQFLGAWKHAQAWISLAPDETFLAVIDRVRTQVKVIDAEAGELRRLNAEIDAIHKERKIKVAHKKSGYTGWLVRLQGSAFKPK